MIFRQFSPVSPFRAVLLWTAGAGFVVLAGLLVREHVDALRAVQGEGLPLAAEVQSLERRLAILTEQTSALRITGDLTGGTAEEQVKLFVLPQGGASERTITLFNAVFDAWKAEGRVKNIAPIVVGKPETVHMSGVSSSLVRRSLQLRLSLHEEDLRDCVTLLRLAGLVTVEDALTPQERVTLLALSEAGNPAQITSLAQFLQTDLLQYLHDPLVADERLLNAFPTDTLTNCLRSFEKTSLIRDGAALARGPVGTVLLQQKLWPLPFLQVSSLEVQEEGDGWLGIDMKLWGYGRE